jgi:hypothetical protein
MMSVSGLVSRSGLANRRELTLKLTALGVRHPGSEGAASQRQNPPFDWVECLPSTASCSRPIFTGIRDFGFETAIRESLAWSYDRQLLGEVLRRQRNF